MVDNKKTGGPGEPPRRIITSQGRRYIQISYSDSDSDSYEEDENKQTATVSSINGGAGAGAVSSIKKKKNNQKSKLRKKKKKQEAKLAPPPNGTRVVPNTQSAVNNANDADDSEDDGFGSPIKRRKPAARQPVLPQSNPVGNNRRTHLVRLKRRTTPSSSNESISELTPSERSKYYKQRAARVRSTQTINDKSIRITRPVLRRLARKAGVKRISDNFVEETRAMTNRFLEAIISDAIVLTVHNDKRIVGEEDIKYALKNNNYKITMEPLNGGAQLALREIRKLKTNVDLLIPKLNFQRLVRVHAMQYNTTIKFKAGALFILQQATEDYIIKKLEEANIWAMSASRSTLNRRDVINAQRPHTPTPVSKATTKRFINNPLDLIRSDIRSRKKHTKQSAKQA